MSSSIASLPALKAPVHQQLTLDMGVGGGSTSGGRARQLPDTSRWEGWIGKT